MKDLSPLSTLLDLRLCHVTKHYIDVISTQSRHILLCNHLTVLYPLYQFTKKKLLPTFTHHKQQLQTIIVINLHVHLHLRSQIEYLH